MNRKRRNLLVEAERHVIEASEIVTALETDEREPKGDPRAAALLFASVETLSLSSKLMREIAQ